MGKRRWGYSEMGEGYKKAHYLRCSKVGKTQSINPKANSLDCHYHEEPQIT